MPDPQPNPAPSATPSTPGPDASLDSAVDALLAEINATCDRFEAPLPPDDGEDEALADLARAAQAHHAGAPQPTDSADIASPVASPVMDAEQALDDAEAAADALLEQAADDLAASLTDPLAGPAGSLTGDLGDGTPETLLDAAVSSLLDGSFESPKDDLVDSQDMGAQPDPALPLDETQTPPPPSAPSRDNAHQPSATPDEQPAPSTPPVRLPAPTPRAVEPEPDPVPGVATTTDLAEPLPRRQTGVAARVTATIVAKALMLLSKPLESQPPRVRDSVGWVALWTVFLAVCVWATVLLRSAPARHDDGTASRVVTPDTPEPFPPPKAQDSHGAQAGGHGAKPAGAHAAPAPSHGAKPASTHAPKAGGHH